MTGGCRFSTWKHAPQSVKSLEDALLIYGGLLVAQWGETYDWRLSVPNMETRDHYFTRLKWRIELTLATEGEKVCSGSYDRVGHAARE